MKKTIRLNESDLHRIISESVGQYLTELDWKTYMNAGKKRLAQGGKKYGNGFDSLLQAEREFNRLYGTNAVYDRPAGGGTRGLEFFDNPEEQGITRTHGHIVGQYDNPHKDVRMQARTDVSTPGRRSKYRTLIYDPKHKYADMDQFWSDNHNPEDIENRFYTGGGIDKNKEPLLAYMIKQNHDRAKDELDAYENGDYEYRKGEGWKKKNESLDRKIDRIVRESVKHVLRESDYEDYNDWAKNSNASDKEKEDAGKRQDKRREGNSFHGDKLAYKQYRHKQFDKRGEDQDNKLALKKRTAKRLRDGWRF